MGAGLDLDLDGEPVAADDAAGRMDEDAVADRVAFGMQHLQDTQRPVVAIVDDGAPVLRAVAERQSAVPAHTCRNARV